MSRFFIADFISPFIQSGWVSCLTRFVLKGACLLKTLIKEVVQVLKLLSESLLDKGLGSKRGVFGPMSKISFTLSNYRLVIWDKNYWRYFVI